MLTDSLVSSLERALQRSEFGLRLVGYPTGPLQELFDRPASTSSPLDSEVAGDGVSVRRRN